MKKIPTLYERDWDGDRSRVTDKVNPEAQWVIDGEGWATRKYDGTAVLVRDGIVYKRREVKPGQDVPAGFEQVDEREGKDGTVLTGWVPADLSEFGAPEDKWLREAVEANSRGTWELPDGTYELVGPKVQGGAESTETHQLVSHAHARAFDNVWTEVDPDDPTRESRSLDGIVVPRDYDGLRAWLAEHPDIEGIVWHHPDGRMAKIKLRDFGIRRA